MGLLLVLLGSNQTVADSEKLDFGFIVSTVSSNPAGGFLQGFITTTIRAERGRVFRVAGPFGAVDIPGGMGGPATFEWVVSRKRKGSAKSDTLLQVSNLDTTDTFTLTINRQYFDQDGVNCTLGGEPITTTLGPGQSAMIHVSEELKPVC
jgi:hypothetical protein